MATETDRLHRVQQMLRTRTDPPPSLAELARAAGLSASRLTRVFRARYGLTPKEWLQSQRVRRLKRSLRDGVSVTDAIYAAGYGSASRVYERSGHWMGMTPRRYQRGGAGLAICHTVVPSGLGCLLVAATPDGICAVTLGDREDQLVQALHEEFPDATHVRVDEGADEWVARAVARAQAMLASGGNMPDPTPIPADLKATAFQWRVWQALMQIPAGQTRSYKQIAQELGAPQACRAVARACASNRLAVIVPCHRVIREDGSLGGYRWGIERKRRLLALERAQCDPKPGVR